MKSHLSKSLILTLTLTMGFFACKDSGNDGPAVVEVQTATDVPGNTENNPGYTFFDLEAGTIVADSSSSQWDIAFSNTTILANSGNGGGILTLNAAFETVTEAPTEGFANETEAGAWYNYTGEAPSGPQHAILAIDGVTLIVKTPEGKYAKVKILSYYQGNPDTSTDEFANFMTRPASPYFTFEYGLQTDGSVYFE